MPEAEVGEELQPGEAGALIAAQACLQLAHGLGLGAAREQVAQLLVPARLRGTDLVGQLAQSLRLPIAWRGRSVAVVLERFRLTDQRGDSSGELAALPSVRRTQRRRAEAADLSSAAERRQRQAQSGVRRSRRWAETRAHRAARFS
jgi:hypothetical protein